MWGCDFKTGAGDWGDPDLAEAVDYARAKGHRVLAVVAGHMHLRTKGGGERPWKQTLDSVDYVNVARVPRIFSTTDGAARHHVCLTVTESGTDFEELVLR